MKFDNSFFSMAFITLQVVGMAVFYVYYSYRNKKAERAYWQKVNEKM